MTDQAVSAPIPLDRESGSSGIYRALLWNLFQIASIGGFALVAASAPVWPPTSPALMVAFSLLVLPQLAITWNLVRVGAAAPSISLWTSSLIAFACAFAFVQWPTT